LPRSKAGAFSFRVLPINGFSAAVRPPASSRAGRCSRNFSCQVLDLRGSDAKSPKLVNRQGFELAKCCLIPMRLNPVADRGGHRSLPRNWLPRTAATLWVNHFEDVAKVPLNGCVEGPDRCGPPTPATECEGRSSVCCSPGSLPQASLRDKRMTRIVIAHHPETIRASDRIIQLRKAGQSADGG